MGANQSIRIKILSDEKQTGKTTWLEENLVNFGGFLSPIRSNKRIFLLLPQKVAIPMENPQGKLEVGKHKFSEFAFEEAIIYVKDQMDLGAIVLDEIGPLELRGQGFAKLLIDLTRNFSGELILVIRKGLVEDVIHHFKLQSFKPEIFSLADAKNDRLISYS